MARFTSLIPSAKIDGRGHVGKETIDEGWSDNFLTGKRFGQNLHAAPKGKKQTCSKERGSHRPQVLLLSHTISFRVLSFKLYFYKDKCSIIILQMLISKVLGLTHIQPYH